MVIARHRGFTLIELMFGLALSSFLMMLAIPFTVAWMDSARQMQARGDIVDAVGRAKALALRNERSLASDVAAAKLKVENGVIEVRDSLDVVVWSATLPRGVALRNFGDTADYECSAYNSRGWLVNAGCAYTTPRLLVQVEGQENLDVELL
jgi:prepilin-type N-terminal cleavage/methylation domain-containing protein